jgi:3-hydroxyacyl-[acyl-carrier-protein] dehydratase
MTDFAPLSPEQEAKLRESFKRCSPETVEAILRFRNERNLCSVIVAVNGIIERYLKLEPGETLAAKPGSTRLGEDLGIDSLTMLEIVMAIEEALDFRIEDSEARAIRTLGDVRQYVDDRVHNRPVSLATVEVYERDRICLILPQQPPFLFLDRGEIRGDTVKGTYLFRGDESFFAGHFRDEPIVPASIVYEALGQAGCLWVLEQVPKRLSLALPANHVLFVGMDEARFARRAKPGDEITLELEMSRLRAPLVVFNGRVTVQGQLLARVEGLTLAFGDISAHENAESAAPHVGESHGTESVTSTPVPAAVTNGTHASAPADRPAPEQSPVASF